MVFLLSISVGSITQKNQYLDLDTVDRATKWSPAQTKHKRNLLSENKSQNIFLMMKNND